MGAAQAPPPCPHPDGHAWVVGRPVFKSADCRRIPANVVSVTRQCRRCLYHDKRRPQPQEEPTDE